MNFAALDDELDLLRGTFSEALGARFPADWKPRPPGELDGSAWEEATRLGWDQVGMPVEQGGFGESLIPLAVLAEEIGRNRVPLPLAETALARSVLAAAGVEQPDAGAVITIAPLSMPSDLNFVGGDRILRGCARRVPWGRRADYLVLAGAGSLVLVDLRTPGVEISEGQNLAGEPRDDVNFDSARARAIVENPELSRQLAERASLLRSAQISGALGAVLALTREHTAARRQFGRSLDRFQLVGAHIAAIAARVALVAALLGDALAAEEAGRGAIPRRALEVVGAEAATTAARSSHQCHGAIGVTGEYRLGHFTRRLWSWRDEAGDEFTARRALGEAIADPAGPDIWNLSTPRPVVA